MHFVGESWGQKVAMYETANVWMLDNTRVKEMDNFNSTLRKLDCVNELLGKYVPPTKSIHLGLTIPWNFTTKTRNTAP